MPARCEFDGEIGEVLCRGDHIRVETLIEKEKPQELTICHFPFAVCQFSFCFVGFASMENEKWRGK
jgi:hypothetical protein